MLIDRKKYANDFYEILKSRYLQFNVPFDENRARADSAAAADLAGYLLGEHRTIKDEFSVR
jgi:hypothetical protein